jgi:hypothetical protein
MRRLATELTWLTLLGASTGCSDPPLTRYAYVMKEVDAPCGELYLFDTDELIRWEGDVQTEACQARPHFGPNSELAWFSFHEQGELGSDEWWLHAFIPNREPWIFHRYKTNNYSRAHFAPSGQHLGIFVEDDAGDIEQAWFETQFGDRDGWMTLSSFVLPGEVDLPKPRWSTDGRQFFVHTYGEGEGPYYSLRPREVVLVDDKGAVVPAPAPPSFPNEVLSFEGQEDFVALLDGAWVQPEVLVLLAVDAQGRYSLVEVTAALPQNRARSLADNIQLGYPFPSPDGRRVAWATPTGLSMVDREDLGPSEMLVAFPGDPLPRRERNLLWLDDTQIAYTVESHPKHIEVLNVESHESTVLAQDPVRDVFDLAWDPASAAYGSQPFARH